MSKEVSEISSLKAEIKVYEEKVQKEQDVIAGATRWIDYHQRQRTKARSNRRLDRRVSDKIIKRHTNRISYEKFRRDCAETDLEKHLKKISELKKRLSELEASTTTKASS